jgi:PST family polysaccharide transporter
MKYITIFNFILRAGATALLFVFVRKPNDYMWVVYLNAVGTLLIGVLSTVTLFRKFRVTFAVPNYVTIMELLRNGLRIFISQIAVTLFTNTNTFILGIFTNNLTVGTYAVAEKIVRAGIALSAPFSSAIYPRTILLFKESRERALSFLRKVLFGCSALFFCVSALLFLFAEPIVSLVTGTTNTTACMLVRIMSILPLSVFIDNIYGVQILLNIGGMQKQFLRAMIVSGIFSIVLQLGLVPHFGAVGTASSFLLTELLVLTLYIIPVRRAGFKLP